MSTTVRIAFAALLTVASAACLSGCKGFKTSFDDPTADSSHPAQATHGAESQSRPMNTPSATPTQTTWPYREAPGVSGGHKPVRRVQVVTFPQNSASLSTEAAGALGVITDELKTNTKWSILVAGFADKMGESAGGQPLGTKRAQAVADYLASRGVAKDRIHLQSLGSTYAEGDQWTKEAQKQDRRAEVWAFWE